MPNSTRYAIHQVVMSVVQAAASSSSAEALNNPALPVGLQGKAPRLLFVLARGDELVDQPGAREKRRCKLVIGAYARTATSDLDADALHFAARVAMRSVRAELNAAGLTAPIVREVQAEPDLKETQTEGAMLLSAYEIEYLETYPAA